MFGIWESVYLHNVYKYIYTIYETFHKRVRVLMFQYVTMSLFFFPQNEKSFGNYITQSPIKNGKISITRCFLLKTRGNPQRGGAAAKKKSLRGFTVLSPQTLSVRCRRATRPMRRMMCLGCFFEDVWKKMLQIYGENFEDVNQAQRTFERWLVLRYFSAKTKMTIEKRKW